MKTAAGAGENYGNRHRGTVHCALADPGIITLMAREADPRSREFRAIVWADGGTKPVSAPQGRGAAAHQPQTMATALRFLEVFS
jgi:hypothetical protein